MVKGTFPSTERVKLPLLHNYLKKVSISLILQGYRDYIRRKTISFMRGSGNLWPLALLFSRTVIFRAPFTRMGKKNSFKLNLYCAREP